MVTILSYGLLSYYEFRWYSPIFIETGSGHGDGIQRALTAGFEHIYSIEAYDENFMVCAARFANDARVSLYRGRSVDILPGIIREPSVFFLDAHPSAENSYGYHEVAQGDRSYMQDTVIRSELAIILADPNRHLVLIDDLNGNSRYCAYQYAELIAQAKGDYDFRFYDEDIGTFYKDKVFAAIPFGVQHGNPSAKITEAQV